MPHRNVLLPVTLAGVVRLLIEQVAGGSATQRFITSVFEGDTETAREELERTGSPEDLLLARDLTKEALHAARTVMVLDAVEKAEHYKIGNARITAYAERAGLEGIGRVALVRGEGFQHPVRLAAQDFLFSPRRPWNLVKLGGKELPPLPPLPPVPAGVLAVPASSVLADVAGPVMLGPPRGVPMPPISELRRSTARPKLDEIVNRIATDLRKQGYRRGILDPTEFNAAMLEATEARLGKAVLNEATGSIAGLAESERHHLDIYNRLTQGLDDKARWREGRKLIRGFETEDGVFLDQADMNQVHRAVRERFGVPTGGTSAPSAPEPAVVPINVQIQNAAVRRALGVERWKLSQANELREIMRGARAKVRGVLQDRLGRATALGVDRGPFSTQRAVNLLAATDEVMNKTWGEAYSKTRDSLIEFAHDETRWQSNLIEGLAGKPFGFEMTLPAAEQLRAIVTDRPFDGALLSDWFAVASQNQRVRTMRAIQEGMVLGRTNQDLIADVVGISDDADDSAAIPLQNWEAEAIVRTAVQHTANTAREALYAQNDDVIKGVQWVATLDTRTCVVCASLDGRVFESDETLASIGGLEATEAPPARTDAAFRSWFGESKVVDEEGAPLVVYHGTLKTPGDWSQQTEELNPEGNLGAGFYFSSDPEDSSSNYADLEGADVQSKIEQKIDELSGADEGGSFADLSPEQQREIAAEQLGLVGGSVFPVYLKMQNPLVIEDDPGARRPGMAGTRFELTDEFAEELWGAMNASATRYQMRQPDHDALREAVGLAIEELGPDATVGAGALFDELVNRTDRIELTDDQGRLVSNEVVRGTFEELGFDGIIDKTVSNKFPFFNLPSDTVHYVVFQPKQIRTAFPEEPEIGGLSPTDAPPAPRTAAFARWFEGSEVVQDGQPAVMYHATSADIANPEDMRPFSHFGTAKAANDRASSLTGFSAILDRKPEPMRTYPVFLKVTNALRMPDLADIDMETGASMDDAWQKFFDDNDIEGGKEEWDSLTRDEQDAFERQPHNRGWEGEEAIGQTLLEMGVINIDEFEEARSNDKALALLKSKGYDGIVYENVVEDPGNDSWIVFDPASQVRTALPAPEPEIGGLGPTSAPPPPTFMEERREAWAALPQEEKDKAGNPLQTIPDRVAELTRDIEMPDTGDVAADSQAYLKQLAEGDEGLAPIPKPEFERLSGGLGRLHELLGAVGATPEDARELSREFVRHMVAQDREAMRRTLGDHGVRHLMGDIEQATSIIQAIPGVDTPEDKLALMLAGAFHDVGYLTPPARTFLDSEHPRWAAQYYRETLAERVEQVIGAKHAGLVERIIATHPETDIDWSTQESTLVSAFRTADNLALFHTEKLPYFAALVPENKSVLESFGAGEIDVETAKKAMRANVLAAKLDSATEASLLNAVEETSPILPKLTLGMYGSHIDRFEWIDALGGGVLRVVVERDPAADQAITKALDLSQNQFIKLAKTYGVDPTEIARTGRLEFGDAMIVDVVNVDAEPRIEIGGTGEDLRDPRVRTLNPLPSDAKRTRRVVYPSGSAKKGELVPLSAEELSTADWLSDKPAGFRAKSHHLLAMFGTSREEMLRNGRTILESALARYEKEGAAYVQNKRFYQNWNGLTKRIADEVGISHERVIAAVAALSPATRAEPEQVGVGGENLQITQVVARAVAANKTLTEEDAAQARAIAQMHVDQFNEKKNPTAAAIELRDMLVKALEEDAFAPGTRLLDVGGGNIELVYRALQGQYRAVAGKMLPVGSNSENYLKAIRVLTSQATPDEVLGDAKVRSFFNNIIDPFGEGDSHSKNDVTVDFQTLDLLAMKNGSDDIASDLQSGLKFNGAVPGARAEAADVIRELRDEYADRIRMLPGEHAHAGEVPANRVQEILWAEWKEGLANQRGDETTWTGSKGEARPIERFEKQVLQKLGYLDTAEIDDTRRSVAPRSKLLKLAKESQNAPDIVRMILSPDADAQANLAEGLGLDSVTKKDVLTARKEIDVIMETRFGKKPVPIRVYHGGTFADPKPDDLVSATTNRAAAEEFAKKNGGQVFESIVWSDEILWDGDALKGQFNGDELLLRPSVFRAGIERAKPSAAAIAFVSPNDSSESFDPTAAVGRLGSEQHVFRSNEMRSIDDRAELPAVTLDALGAWTTDDGVGAENSGWTIYDKGTKYEEIRRVTAVKAHNARQLDALLFKPEEKGENTMRVIPLKKEKPEDVAAALKAQGIQFFTFALDNTDKVEAVMVIDFDGSVAKGAAAAAKKLGSIVHEVRGTAEFLAGGDQKDREAARARYREIVKGTKYEAWLEDWQV